jgi:hypothetical protein
MLAAGFPAAQAAQAKGAADGTAQCSDNRRLLRNYRIGRWIGSYCRTSDAGRPGNT